MQTETQTEQLTKNLPHGRVSVLLPLPVYQPYDYLNENFSLAVGDFVEVPFGRRFFSGVVVGVGCGMIDTSRLKYVLKKYDVPRLSKEIIDFINWVATYNMAPVGAVLKMVLSVPEALNAPRTVPGFFKTRNEHPQKLKITFSRKTVLDFLSDHQPHTMQDITKKTKVTSSVVKGLVAIGVIETVPITEKAAVELVSFKEPIKPLLNIDQHNAANQLVNLLREKSYSVCLVDGVTGSGKTEVYFEAVVEALRTDKQVLILVPEIALSQPFLDRFEERFGFKPAEWHSDLSRKKRRQTWRAVVYGKVQVLIGARSALFLPFPDLGLIVVDEEHEAAFKQTDGVKYQCRDMAVVRARVGAICTILVSATPSLETLTNYDLERYKRVSLTARYGGAELPVVSAIDMRKISLAKGQWIAEDLANEILNTLIKEEQVLLFLNRRGYAPLSLCRACGHRLECPNCSAWLVDHRAVSILKCHHCDYRMKFSSDCFKCGAVGSLSSIGPGVERLKEEVSTRFPNARVVIASSDTLSSPAVANEFIRSIKEGRVDIIIGTQVIAKGHHFPLVTCVGVIDADLGLVGGDLRAGERTYQLLHQVAGRAGRETRPGKVWLQTHQPEHPLIKALINWDRDGFLREEKRGRLEAGMPPFGKLAAVIISAYDPKTVDDMARIIASTAPYFPNLQVLGPTPAPMALLRGRHRRRFLIKSTKNVNLQKVMKTWLNNIKLPTKVKLEIDIDPYNFM